MTRPWPPGAVTGIGSLPGLDPDQATALVFDELPDLPHLPELPARGPGADLIGRGAALLIDLPVEIAVADWRMTAHVGRDLRAARDLLDRDLDALQRTADGYAGALKVQVTGPWTLAANVELASGHKVATDPGATRDLAASLREGVSAHLGAVGARVPGAQLVLQLDEPSLPAVLAGRVPTPSGWGTVRAVEPAVVDGLLRPVLETVPAGRRVVHCCAADAPIPLLCAAGADALSVDASLLTRGDYDALGEAVDSGVSLWLGVVPGSDTAITLDAARDPIRRLWSELGFAADRLADAVVATPRCGLAGASPAYVRRVLSVLRDLGGWLREGDG